MKIDVRQNYENLGGNQIMENITERMDNQMTFNMKIKEADFEWLMRNHIYACALAWRKKAEGLYDSIKVEMKKVAERVEAINRYYASIKRKIEDEIERLKEKCEAYEALLRSYEEAINDADKFIEVWEFEEAERDTLKTTEEIQVIILQCMNETKKEIEELQEKCREIEANKNRECAEVRNSYPQVEIQRKADYCIEQAKKIEMWIQDDDEDYYYQDYEERESSDYSDEDYLAKEY